MSVNSNSVRTNTKNHLDKKQLQQQQQQQQQQQEEKEKEKEKEEADKYATLTKRLLQIMAIMNSRPPEVLTRTVFQSLFGNPQVVQKMMRLWCRTVPRINPNTSLSEVLLYLATAPLVPCIRDHLVVEKDGRSVYLLPFGDKHPIGAALQLPLSQLDPRVNRVLQVFIGNELFTQARENSGPHKFWTWHNFVYTKEAQDKFNSCRPLFLAAVSVAVVTEIRLLVLQNTNSMLIWGNSLENTTKGGSCMNTYSSSSSIPPVIRAKQESELLKHPLTYIQVMQERKLLQELYQQLQDKIRTNLKTRIQRLGAKLLLESIQFALENKILSSTQLQYGDNQKKPPLSTIHMPYLRYPALRTNEEIMQFEQQTRSNWLNVMSQAQAVL